MTTWEKWAEWVNQQLQGHQRKLERIEKERKRGGVLILESSCKAEGSPDA